ncbi:hypothetical protein [Maribacter sp. Asnod1-A12]|uniref:hypothetical protein n=1 Tax=Maribacter sp. Asnod1-A12 TaxID=3160576 RepID=UPI0038690992
MNRDQAFNVILKFLYENQNNYWNLIPTCREKLDINDSGMISSICEEMINKKWVSPKNQDKLSVSLNYNGRIMYEKYGSYSSFIRSENDIKKKAHRSKITPEVIKISIAIIFGLSTAILGWLNYTDNKKLEVQRTEIKQLNNAIDSLQTEIKKRHTTQSINNADLELKC